MTVFAYIALDERGAEQRGQVEATNERQAAQTLRRRAVHVLSLRESAEGEFETTRASNRRDLRITGLARHLPVRTRDLVFLFQRLALMLRSGHTVVESLEINRQIAERRRLEVALAEMARAIRAGGSLSRAVAAQGNLFPPAAHRLLAAGEQTGDVEQILSRLAEDLERRQDVRRQLITALTYPAIVFFMAVGVAVALVGWVIPRLAGFLASRDVALPPVTQLLLDISDWFHRWGGVLGAAMLFLMLGVLVAYTTRRGREFLDGLLLELPLVGPLVMSAAIAEASWALAMQLRSGINVLAALRTLSGVLANRALGGAFAQAAEHVLAGQTLSMALPGRIIPPLVRHMVAVGERSGELDAVMDSLGEFYRKDLQARVRTLSAWVEPALILCVGGMVAIVYLAFFQAALRASTGGI